MCTSSTSSEHDINITCVCVCVIHHIYVAVRSVLSLPTPTLALNHRQLNDNRHRVSNKTSMGYSHINGILYPTSQSTILPPYRYAGTLACIISSFMFMFVSNLTSNMIVCIAVDRARVVRRMLNAAEVSIQRGERITPSMPPMCRRASRSQSHRL
jgi:hypothetical protein